MQAASRAQRADFCSRTLLCFGGAPLNSACVHPFHVLSFGRGEITPERSGFLHVPALCKSELTGVLPGALVEPKTPGPCPEPCYL